jgi:REP element-mobilizing transposase RayT
MPRKLRTDAAGAIHHVIARGNARTRIVEDDEDRRAFIGSLAAVSGRLEWRVHAYCLMDTHVHAVIETPIPTLGVGMKRLLGGHAFQFNRRHNRFGHLFAGRYAASEIDSDAYLLEVCAYVVLNPVRAGLVIEPGEWKWSSYRFAAGIARVPLFVETSVVPGMLANEPQRARQLYRQLVREIAARPRPGSG